MGALVSNVVAAEVKLSNRLTQTQAILQTFDPLKTNLILLEAEHLQVLFVFETLSKSHSSLGEDPVHTKS